MKSLIGLCLISMIVCGCSANRAEQATPPLVVHRDDKPSVPGRMPMEHRLVSVSAEERSTQPTTRPNRYPAQQRWTSSTVVTEFPFTELLPSWNVDVPGNAGVRWDVRVRDAADGEWSPWLYIGYWGRVTQGRRETEFDGGAVEIDILKLRSPADAFELRATAMSFDLPQPTLPTVRRVQAVYSRPLGAEALAKAEKSAGSPLEPVDLPVPFRPQGIEDKCISGSICSPMSVSMVMQWAGIDRPTQENALAIWDDDYSLFGNWNRAVQYAATLGLEAHLERFSTMDQVRARLAKGQPIIASINFEAGTFPSIVMKSTDGHLIVIRGFNEQGDLIVNDPASKDRGNGVVYRDEELAKAWLVNTGGVGYIIHKAVEQAGLSGSAKN